MIATKISQEEINKITKEPNFQNILNNSCPTTSGSTANIVTTKPLDGDSKMEIEKNGVLDKNQAHNIIG